MGYEGALLLLGFFVVDPSIAFAIRILRLDGQTVTDMQVRSCCADYAASPANGALDSLLKASLSL